MSKLKKRALAMLLSLCMVLTMTPSMVFASAPGVNSVEPIVGDSTDSEQPEAMTGAVVQEPTAMANNNAIQPIAEPGKANGGVAYTADALITALGGADYASKGESGSENVVTLKQNVTLAKYVNITGGELTLNLGEFSIQRDDTAGSTVFYVTGGTFTIEGNGTVSSKNATDSNVIAVDGASAVMNIKGGTYVVDTESEGNTQGIAIDNKATLNISGGIISSTDNVAIGPVNGATLNISGNTQISSQNSFAIGTNGSDVAEGDKCEIKIEGNPQITSGNSVGIYLPSGEMEIKGGTISGTTGIEVRAGKLTVNGNNVVITGIGEYAEPVANGNGPTSSGAGIAVSQHNTDKSIEVTIENGTVKGAVAFEVANPQGNENAADDITLNIEEGNFQSTEEGQPAILVDEDVTGSKTPVEVSGGIFKNSEEKPDTSVNMYVQNKTHGVKADGKIGPLTASDPYVASVTTGENTTYYGTLEAAVAVATANDTVTLNSDVTLDAPLAINHNLTLNLNGHNIIGPANEEPENSQAIQVKTGTLTLTGEGKVVGKSSVASAIKLTENAGGLVIGKNVTVEQKVQGAKDAGALSGVVVAGNNKEVKIVVDGKIDATVESDAEGSGTFGININGKNTNTTTVEVNGTVSGSVAIYGAGESDITINENARVEGYDCGVELRNGKLDVKGGTITATNPSKTTVEANGSGATTSGAAVSVSPHSGKKVEVTIEGGELTGSTGLVLADSNSAGSEKVTASVTGGTITGVGENAQAMLVTDGTGVETHALSDALAKSNPVKGGTFQTKAAADGSAVVDSTVFPYIDETTNGLTANGKVDQKTAITDLYVIDFGYLANATNAKTAKSFTSPANITYNSSDWLNQTFYLCFNRVLTKDEKVTVTASCGGHEFSIDCVGKENGTSPRYAFSFLNTEQNEKKVPLIIDDWELSGKKADGTSVDVLEKAKTAKVNGTGDSSPLVEASIKTVGFKIAASEAQTIINDVLKDDSKTVNDVADNTMYIILGKRISGIGSGKAVKVVVNKGETSVYEQTISSDSVEVFYFRFAEEGKEDMGGTGDSVAKIGLADIPGLYSVDLYVGNLMYGSKTIEIDNIVYDAGSGHFADNVKTINSYAMASDVEAVEAPETNPTRSGYSFTGWSSPSKSDYTITYTAQWRSNGGGGGYLPPATTTPTPTPSVTPEGPTGPVLNFTDSRQEKALQNRSLMDDDCTLKLAPENGEDLADDYVITSDNEDVVVVKDGKLHYVGVGSANVTVTAVGKDSGTTYTVTFPVTVKEPKTPTFTPSNLSSTKKKTFTVTTSTIKGADGFEVQFSLKNLAKTTKGARITDIGGGKKSIRATVSTYKSGRVYYARVRAYKMVDGKKITTAWSPIKTRRSR